MLPGIARRKDAFDDVIKVDRAEHGDRGGEGVCRGIHSVNMLGLFVKRPVGVDFQLEIGLYMANMTQWPFLVIRSGMACAAELAPEHSMTASKPKDRR